MKNMAIPKDNTRSGDMLSPLKIPLFVCGGFDRNHYNY
jgi:hypothetical protein